MERAETKLQTAVGSVSGTGSVLERLRLQTQDVHRSLEDLPIWEAAFSNLRAYSALLDGFLSLVRPADAAIAMTLGKFAPEGFSATVRSDWLESDRRAIVGPQATAQSLRSVEDDALIGDLASGSRFAAAGALYVIEGSALGGRILSRRLQESLGIDPDNGGRYFFGHGADTAARWRRFLDWLDVMQFDPAGADSTACAARAVFERFRERLATLRYD